MKVSRSSPPSQLRLVLLLASSALLPSYTHAYSHAYWQQKFVRKARSNGNPEPTQYEKVMMETVKLRKAGFLPDYDTVPPQKGPGSLLDSWLPADLTEETEEHYRRNLQGASAWRFMGVSIPMSTGASASALNASFYRYASVSPPPSVDWRTAMAGKYVTKVQAQYNCASCWAMAASDTVAMAYAIATNATALAAGVQQLCDCSDMDCCQGGWPEDAFAWMLSQGNITTQSNYNYWAMDDRNCTLKKDYPVAGKLTGWERVPAFSSEALKKAVAMHPVLVYISAGSKEFMQYTSGPPTNLSSFRVFDGNCTQEINHALVAVGYSQDANGSYYWILKNSWIAESWGDNGYMYLRMQDGSGKCGMLTVSPLYPVYYPGAPVQVALQQGNRNQFTPVLASSAYWWSTWKATQTNACSGIINPCGAGRCYSVNGIARCNCSDTNGFVELVGVPTSKCVNPLPCSAGLNNPCGAGTCTDVGDGSYFCSCTPVPGYVVGALVNGAPTCVPQQAVMAKSFTYMPQYGETCRSIMTAYGVNATTLLLLNPNLACDRPLVPGYGILLPPSASSAICTTQYALQPSDSCTKVSFYMSQGTTDTLVNAQYSPDSATSTSTSTPTSTMLLQTADVSTWRDTSDFTTANPTVNCNSLFQSQLICLRKASDTGVRPATCGTTYSSIRLDTCASVMSKFTLTFAAFSSLNPGLDCSKLPQEGVQLCVSSTPPYQVNCTSWYTVQQGDSCAQIWNSAQLSQFQMLYINPGLQCQDPFLYVGLQICINSPLLNNIQDPSFLTYTITNKDSWSTIQGQFTSKCKPSSITVTRIASFNNIADWSAVNVKQMAGDVIVIPCVPKVGASCGCAPSLPVCGSDLVTYDSYCDARCNFATPLRSDSACNDCYLACAGRYGRSPNPLSACPTGTQCWWPYWAPSMADATATFTTSPLCSYRSQTCMQACAIFNAENNLPSTSTACYNDCYACFRVPCSGPAVTVNVMATSGVFSDVGSPCPNPLNCSSPGCSPGARATQCSVGCTYFNSLSNPQNP